MITFERYKSLSFVWIGDYLGRYDAATNLVYVPFTCASAADHAAEELGGCVHTMAEHPLFYFSVVTPTEQFPVKVVA